MALAREGRAAAAKCRSLEPLDVDLQVGRRETEVAHQAVDRDRANRAARPFSTR